MKKNETEQRDRDLEEAVTLGMGKGWTHNSGTSVRCCCPWNKTVNV